MNKLLPLLIFFLLLPIAYADLDGQCTESRSGFLSGSALGPLEGPFEMLMTLLSNEVSVYILMFIFMFMMLYGIVFAALGKVKVFDGQKRQGKIVAVSIAMMTNLAFFGITSRYGGPKAILYRFLSAFELFGGIILATVMFLVVYYGFRQKEERSWKLALGAAGLALLLAGSIICAPTWTSIGFFIMFLALIFAGLFNLGNFGFGGDDPKKPPTPPVPPTPPTPPTPPSPPQPPTPPGPTPPPDFTRELDRMEELLDEYSTAFDDFKQAGNEILQTHHEFMNPGGIYSYNSSTPPVSVDQWNSFFSLNSNMDSIEKNFNDTVNSIVNHPNYGSISEEQQNLLNSRMIAFSSLLNSRHQYYNRFLAKYQNAEAP